MSSKTFPPLYCKRKGGKFGVWKIRTEGATIITESGQLDGNLKETIRIAEGKNIGRANETTPEQQAEKEAQARWKKQTEKDYRETVEALDEIPLFPMLALDGSKEKEHKRMVEQVIVDPKLNGIRCWYTRGIDGGWFATSRNNKEFPANPEIEAELEKLFEETGITEWDGELYAFGYHLQDINSMVTNTENPERKQLKFWIFDTDMHGDEPAWHRKNRIKTVQFAATNIGLEKLVFVPGVSCHKDKVFEWRDFYENKGYEGAIARNPDALYMTGPKKTKEMMKYKNFVDEEFIIDEISCGEEGRAIIHFVVNKSKGIYGKAEMVGSDDAAREVYVLREAYLGKQATIKFQDKSRDGVPNFAKCLAIRNYE